MPPEPRVLVIDDDLDCATSLTEMLRTLGCEAECGFGPSMAPRITQIFKPNLVFLDLELQSADGCQVLQDLKGMADPGTIFVCLTGNATEEAERRCTEAGFNHFVRKPLSAGQLAKLLKAARLAGQSRSTPREQASAGESAAPVLPAATTTVPHDGWLVAGFDRSAIGDRPSASGA